VRLESYRRVDAPRPGDVALGVRRVPRESDTGSIWGAALSTLTLGIVPYFGDAGTSLTIRWSAPNGANDVGARESTCAGEVPTVFGWIAPVIAAREGWRLGGPPTEGTDERHAGLARLGLCVARSLDAYVGECGVTRGSR
jgi:hypothetical protein